MQRAKKFPLTNENTDLLLQYNCVNIIMLLPAAMGKCRKRVTSWVWNYLEINWNLSEPKMKAKLNRAVLFILFLGILQRGSGRAGEQAGQALIQLSHGKLSNKPVKLFII